MTEPRPAVCPYCGERFGQILPGSRYSIEHRGDGSHSLLTWPNPR